MTSSTSMPAAALASASVRSRRQHESMRTISKTVSAAGTCSITSPTLTPAVMFICRDQNTGAIRCPRYDLGNNVRRPGLIIALLADVHSNLEALRACLKHAAGRGAERYAFLGDLVGYGADPAAVVDIVADHASRGAIVVKGNHEAAVTQGARSLNDAAHEAIEWTRNALSPGQRGFLASLPLIIHDGSMCFVHASAA